MGKKEQEKKAKRVAAGPSDAPPCKAAAPKAPVSKRPAGPAAGSGSRPSGASSGAVEAESLVAGSGNPASSVSSGRAEADGWKWEYNEGKNGLYTCVWCKNRPYRSWFLIEATDLDGTLCVERDVDGSLYGRCYECCRGRGRCGGDDMYADLVKQGADEETLGGHLQEGVQ